MVGLSYSPGWSGMSCCVLSNKTCYREQWHDGKKGN